jgi:hypothetical protein
MNDSAEDHVWKTIDPELIWVMDKLIVSRKMRYNCGPAGLDVPHPGFYIVRPCVNMLGLGLGAKKMWLEKDTHSLPYGYFWCEWFEGRHLSIDYFYGKQELCVEGRKSEHTFTQWDDWTRTDDVIPFPNMLLFIPYPHKWINCEFIGGKLIEVHLRRNEDFDEHTEHFIPVWTGQDTTPPEGYTYRDYPDVHGRVGAFVK